MTYELLTDNISSVLEAERCANILKTKHVNYLHSGNALDKWSEFLQQEGLTLNDGSQIKRIYPQTYRHSRLRNVIISYRRSHKTCGLDEIERVLNSSEEWRKLFKALGCRGFSYGLDLKMNGYNRQNSAPYQLNKETNLRVALMSNRDLFYPSSVRRNLRLLPGSSNHYFQDKSPSIAFCLGKKTKEAWYILVMQSDVDSRARCMDEHFRGWRKILFANIAARAYGRVGALYLCRAEDVARGCFPGTNETGHVSTRWSSIYDGTAHQWGMPLVKLKEPMDIQVHRGQDPVFARYFYKLDLSSGPKSVF